MLWMCSIASASSAAARGGLDKWLGRAGNMSARGASGRWELMARAITAAVMVATTAMIASLMRHGGSPPIVKRNRYCSADNDQQPYFDRLRHRPLKGNGRASNTK